MGDSSHTLAALREIARALSTARDLDTTLDLIARKTTEVMGVQSCTIYLLDPDGETLWLRASTGLAPRTLGRVALKVGEGLTGAAMADNAPVYAAIARQDPRFKLLDEEREKLFQSLLAVPLVLGDRPLGAMNVQTVAAHDYTPAEIETLLLIADLAAGALAKAQLIDRQRSQLDELETLARLSEAMIAPHYLDDMLDVVTEMAGEAMNAAVCTLFLLDESGEQLEQRAARRTATRYTPRPPLRLDEGVVGWVTRTGQIAYVPDVLADARYAFPELARAEGLVSMLAVPLNVRERTLGALCCYTTEPRLFTPAQITLFSTVANHTALALENSRLVTNAALIREMHHRIKNNLHMVVMLMQLQLAEVDRVDPRQVLESNMLRIRSMAAVHEALSEKGFRLVDVKQVLQRIAQATADALSLPQRQVTLEVAGETWQLPSKAATALALVVNELVHNALEHGLAGRPQGHIHISLGRSPQELIVVVRDDGLGIPESFQPGLGLEIVQTLVRDELRGRLQFKRIQPGAEVSLRLPRTLERLEPTRRPAVDTA